MFYRTRIYQTKKSSVPVIVVGNLTVGGTGKTPLVIHIAQLLQKNHFSVGIISRGYKGSHNKPTHVDKDSDPTIIGDEPLLFAKTLDCPIVVGRDRQQTMLKLLQSNKIDILISDDGLQHYGLARNIEIVVVDGVRQFGNGYCLPVGPLREPVSRLTSVDFIISNGGIPKKGEHAMYYIPNELYHALDPSQKTLLTQFSPKIVHAIAGIGNPAQFFQLLTSYGFQVIPHAYPDHYQFTQNDIHFNDEYPVILTEKDAVKCQHFFNERHWILPIIAKVSPIFDTQLLTLVEGFKRG